TLCTGNHFGTVGFCLFNHPLCTTPGFRNNRVGISLSFVLQPFFILFCLDDIVKRSADLLWRTPLLNIDIPHKNAGAVVIEISLQALLHLCSRSEEHTSE